MVSCSISRGDWLSLASFFQNICQWYILMKVKRMMIVIIAIFRVVKNGQAISSCFLPVVMIFLLLVTLIIITLLDFSREVAMLRKHHSLNCSVDKFQSHSTSSNFHQTIHPILRQNAHSKAICSFQRCSSKSLTILLPDRHLNMLYRPVNCSRYLNITVFKRLW